VLDSDFWNDLGKQFRSIKNCKDVCVNWADVPGAELETWEFAAAGTALLSERLEFEALARRAGAKTNPESDDPFAEWLSRLKREGRADLVKVGATYPWGDMTKGQIQEVCRASADYCKILETRALHSEQQVNRRHGRPAATVKQSALEVSGKGRKRGPQPNLALAAQISEIVARIAPDGDWRSKLDDIRTALDAAQVPCPSRWRTNRSWEGQPEDALVRKIMEYRLRQAKQQTTPSVKTLS
jgi:hypothetical protein